MNRYEQKQQARREGFASLSERAAKVGAALMSRAVGMAAALPSRTDDSAARTYRVRMQRAYAQGRTAQQRAAYLAHKAERVGHRGIAADDPEALQKLAAEVAHLDAVHERMKAANRAIRNQMDRAALVAALVDLGLSQGDALDLLKKDALGRKGYEAQAFQRNRAAAARLRDRISEIEVMRSRADVVIQGEGYEYRENVQENRVMFFFRTKPCADVRSLLYRYAFKYSPSREGQPWIRQMTQAALQAAAQLRAELDQFNQQ